MGATRNTYIEAINSVVSGEMTTEDVADIIEEHIDSGRGQIEKLTIHNSEYRDRLAFLLEHLSDAKKDYEENYKPI